MRTAVRFSALPATRRAAALLDPGTLATLGDPPTARSVVWIGTGKIAGRKVLLGLTSGEHRGGTIGVQEAKILSQLTAAAESKRPAAVVTCWDTGGVRVQEGPAALAAASAVGVGLTRLALRGLPVATVISGTRGCFGAPAVIAAASHAVILTRQARWGLTGPRLLDNIRGHGGETAARRATSAAYRFRARQASALVADSTSGIRARLIDFVARPPRPMPLEKVLDNSVARATAFKKRLRAERSAAQPSPNRVAATRPRDLFRFSFRGQWRATTPVTHRGQVQAAWGELYGRPAMGIIVGSDRSRGGLGVEGAYTVTEMVRRAARESRREPAPIVTFLFCRGHANDLQQERAGLPCALAECLKSMVAARLLGHPLLCILGGGAYGAAYLALAAPSHRIIAIRGTTVAPMAPRVLAAFQRLQGLHQAREAPQDLARLIPGIRIVESVVRLARALRDELYTARVSARGEAASS